MVNQIIIVGKIKEFNKLTNKKLSLLLSVPQSFKNKDGKFEDDLIDCEVDGNIATATNDYCKVGDIVGIRGRLESIYSDNKRLLKIVVEKITFLSSKSK